jgi:hypothetical protein
MAVLMCYRCRWICSFMSSYYAVSYDFQYNFFIYLRNYQMYTIKLPPLYAFLNHLRQVKELPAFYRINTTCSPLLTLNIFAIK